MFFEIDDEAIRKRAKTPHELSMLNLAGFHLLAAPATLVLDYKLHIGLVGFLLPLSLSLLIIAYTWYKARQSRFSEHWFVAAHWRVAANRTRILLIGYALTAAILLFALLVTSGSSKADIMLVALTRIAILPVLVTVMICFVLESGSIYQAGRNEVPNGVARQFPPPDDLPVRQDPAGTVNP